MNSKLADTLKGKARVLVPTSLGAMVNWPMTTSKLKDHFEPPDGLSSLHLLDHDPATDTVTYEERIQTPAAANSNEIAAEPKTTTAQLWMDMTGGEAE